jgi:hypothetical protein
MIDVVVIYTDKDLFGNEETQFVETKSRAISDGTEFMRLLRVASAENIPAECEILGSYDEIAADSQKLLKYRQFHPESDFYTDTEGIEQVKQNAFEFVRFA